MVKWIVLSVGGLAGLVALVALVGAFLPQAHVASRSATYRQSPEAVYAAITAFAATPSWRDDVKRVEMLPALSEGRVRYREHAADGAVTYEAEESIEPRRLVTRIVDRDLPYGGSWLYELEPVSLGTRLRITERGEVYNPIFRFVSRFIMGHHATMETYLVALGRKFGERVTPE